MDNMQQDNQWQDQGAIQQDGGNLNPAPGQSVMPSGNDTTSFQSDSGAPQSFHDRSNAGGAVSGEIDLKGDNQAAPADGQPQDFAAPDSSGQTTQTEGDSLESELAQGESPEEVAARYPNLPPPPILETSQVANNRPSVPQLNPQTGQYEEDLDAPFVGAANAFKIVGDGNGDALDYLPPNPNPSPAPAPDTPQGPGAPQGPAGPQQPGQPGSFPPTPQPPQQAGPGPSQPFGPQQY